MIGKLVLVAAALRLGDAVHVQGGDGVLGGHVGVGEVEVADFEDEYLGGHGQLLTERGEFDKSKRRKRHERANAFDQLQPEQELQPREFENDDDDRLADERLPDSRFGRAINDESFPEELQDWKKREGLVEFAVNELNDLEASQTTFGSDIIRHVKGNRLSVVFTDHLLKNQGQIFNLNDELHFDDLVESQHGRDAFNLFIDWLRQNNVGSSKEDYERVVKRIAAWCSPSSDVVNMALGLSELGQQHIVSATVTDRYHNKFNEEDMKNLFKIQVPNVDQNPNAVQMLITINRDLNEVTARKWAACSKAVPLLDLGTMNQQEREAAMRPKYVLKTQTTNFLNWKGDVTEMSLKYDLLMGDRADPFKHMKNLMKASAKASLEKAPARARARGKLDAITVAVQQLDSVITLLEHLLKETLSPDKREWYRKFVYDKLQVFQNKFEDHLGGEQSFDLHADGSTMNLQNGLTMLKTMREQLVDRVRIVQLELKDELRTIQKQ